MKAVPELVKLFKYSSLRSRKCLLRIYFDEIGKFVQYIQNEIKSTYKQIKYDNEIKDKKIAELFKAKSDLKKVVGSMENKIEFYRQADISLKEHRDQNEDGNDHCGDNRDPYDLINCFYYTYFSFTKTIYY